MEKTGHYTLKAPRGPFGVTTGISANNNAGVLWNLKPERWQQAAEFLLIGSMLES